MTRRTLLKSAFAVSSTTMAPAVAPPAAAQERTVYEPSASDPRIVAALDAQKRLGVAMIGGDFKAVEMMFANDLVDGVWKLTIRQATVTSVQ